MFVILRKCRSREHRTIYDDVLVTVSLTRAQKDALDMAYGKVLHKCASVQIPYTCNTVNTPRKSIRDANWNGSPGISFAMNKWAITVAQLTVIYRVIFYTVPAAIKMHKSCLSSYSQNLCGAFVYNATECKDDTT